MQHKRFITLRHILENNAPFAGQSVFHLHMHLLGGEALGSMVTKEE
jgi:diadenosine tetraphosphate (Ap4A) HIT family hydrolase